MAGRYKIAIVGFGSIGKRHLENLSSVLSECKIDYSIDLIRSGKGSVLDENSRMFVEHVYHQDDNIPSDYDIIFITNPTHLHFDAMQKFVLKTKHMFIEKPVFDRTNIDLTLLGLKKDSIYYVACPLRYTKVVQYLKNEIDLEKVICARVISSSYLPEWRPGKDYRNTYSAQVTQGGGVSLDLIHEWDYIQYLFGPPIKWFNIRGTFSNLEISSDDLSLYIAKYPHMAVEVHLDYFGRKTVREAQLFMVDDVVVGDIALGEIRFLKSGVVIPLDEDRNAFQRKELVHFLEIIQGRRRNDSDLLLALNTLKIAQGEK